MKPPRLTTEDKDGVLVLATGRAHTPQSAVRPGDPSHLEFEYTRLIVASLLVTKARRILVLGLGAGTMPRFFRWLMPESDVDAIELDPAVVRVASDELELAIDSRLRVTIGDARAFLEKTSERWDLIVADAFLGDVAPPHLSTLEFFRLAREHLSAGGAFVQNVWGPPNPRFGLTRRTLREAFGTVIDFAGAAERNHVLIALAEATTLTLNDLLARARQPIGAQPLPFDLVAELEKAWVGLVPRNAPGRILRDEVTRPKLTRTSRRT